MLHYVHMSVYCTHSHSADFLLNRPLNWTLSICIHLMLYFFLPISLSSRMYTPKESGSPNKQFGKGVPFFNHFHKAFLRPYGKAESAPESSTIFNRINARKCERLCHPQVALSELADTMHENIPAIEGSPLINGDALAGVLEHLAELTNALLPFERTSDTVPSIKNANTLLRLTIHDNELDRFFEKAFELGGALFSASLTYLVFRDLARDPAVYAERLASKDVHSLFKSSQPQRPPGHFHERERSKETRHATTSWGLC